MRFSSPLHLKRISQGLKESYKIHKGFIKDRLVDCNRYRSKPQLSRQVIGANPIFEYYESGGAKSSPDKENH
jgi:hypothetical protein